MFPKRLRFRFANLLLLLVYFFPWLSGCFIFNGYYAGTYPFQHEDVVEVQPGHTSTREILERFGPPVAIARPGQILHFPKAGLTREGYIEVQAETFFALFSSHHNLDKDHLIYYYHYTRLESSSVLILFVVKEKRRLHVQELWLLVNDRTQKVVDLFYREAPSGDEG